MAQLATAIDAVLALLKGTFVVDTSLFDIFGFNRGATAARYFVNHIQVEDQAIVSTINTGMMEYEYRGAPAGNIRFLGIMDTVAAVGTVANRLDLHSADAGNIILRLHPGVAQKVFHLTARNECRCNSALNNIAPTWPELTLPGVHSDIGGGYMPQLHEDLFLTRPRVGTLPQGQPKAQSHTYAQTMAQLRVLEHSPVIMPIIHTHEITSEVQEDPRAPTNRCTQPQERASTALTLCQRAIFSDWSKVALRVMVDAAVGAGALLADVDKIQGHALPDTLKPLCEQAREMGKAACRYRSTTGFTPKEVDRIVGRYIHYSAHQNAVNLRQSRELQGGASTSETVDFVNRPGANWIRAIYNMDGNKR